MTDYSILCRLDKTINIEFIKNELKSNNIEVLSLHSKPYKGKVFFRVKINEHQMILLQHYKWIINIENPLL